MNKSTQYRLFLTLIIVLFLAQFLFISPRGEFALNDDWVHTDTLKHWVDTGEFRMLPFAGPSFYTPILYGAALVKIFGFSFTLLRISTLVLTLALLLVFYSLLCRITQKPALSFFGTLLLWWNPMAYSLSFSFMADIPALFWVALSMYAYYRGFEEKKHWWLFLGSCGAILAFYTRQTGILLFIAAGLAAFIQYKKFSFPRLFAGFGIPLLAGAVAYAYLATHHYLPGSIKTHVIKDLPFLFGHMLQWAWYSAMHLGFFFLPLTIGWIALRREEWKNKWLWAAILAPIGGAGAVYAQSGQLFPYIGNTLSVHGLGSMDALMDGPYLHMFPNAVWSGLTICAAVGLGLLGYGYAKKREHHPPLLFLTIFISLQLLTIMVFESFDRYLLPVIAALVVLFLYKIKDASFSYRASILILLVFFVFDITQTRHYLAWNAARWDLANTPLSQGVPQHHIDGGYEWDGWHGYWSAQRSGMDGGPGGTPWWVQKLFYNNTREYVVNMSPIPGYDTVSERRLKEWNPNNRLYLLRKRGE